MPAIRQAVRDKLKNASNNKDRRDIKLAAILLEAVTMAGGGKRSKLTEDIQRLKFLDSQLRASGVNVPAVASEWETSQRTVHRYLDALRELVGPTEAARADDLHFRQRYSGKPARLFAR